MEFVVGFLDDFIRWLCTLAYKAQMLHDIFFWIDHFCARGSDWLVMTDQEVKYAIEIF